MQHAELGIFAVIAAMTFLGVCVKLFMVAAATHKHRQVGPIVCGTPCGMSRTFLNEVPRYAEGVLRCKTAAEVLNLLQDVVAHHHRLFSVLGAWQLPRRYTDLDFLVLGKTVFFQEDVPPEFWPEYLRLLRLNGSSPTGMLARVRIVPFTLTEAMHQSGGSRWIFDLFFRQGWRDCVYMPIGLWAVVVVCQQRISHLSAEERSAWLMLGAVTASRLEMIRKTTLRSEEAPLLTPREIAVLRNASVGKTPEETAPLLGIKQTTVRTLLSRAQRKLGATNRTHAVAEAMRRRLFD
jgi:DNA-binding CsgD family transcriptional regulator